MGRYRAVFIKHRKLTGIYLTLAVIYIAQSLLYKPDSYFRSKYHVSALGSHLLLLSMLVPSLITWFFSWFAYLSFRSYAESLRNSKEWYAAHSISAGLFWLAFFSPVSSISSELITYIHGTHPHYLPAAVQLTNYATLAVALVAGGLMYTGSVRLMKQLKFSDTTPFFCLTLAYIALIGVYVYAIFHAQLRPQAVTSTILPSTYLEPSWLVDVTIIVPRLILWFLFLTVAYNFYMYGKKVKGVFYRKAFGSLARGVAFASVAVIVLRVVQTLPLGQGRFGPALLLVCTYMILLLLNLGLALIASGSHNLRKIEEL